MTATVDDGHGGTDSQTFSWVIAEANVAPVLTNPGAQSGTAGVAITPLQLVATDGNNDPLTFSATGLPAGLSISAGGLITGTPSAAGTSSVTATVRKAATKTRRKQAHFSTRPVRLTSAACRRC